MPEFTVAQLENAFNASIDFHFKKPDVLAQHLQNKPLLKAMRAKQKTFPGGLGEITVGVTGETTTTIQGFINDDTVTYGNPANIKRARYPWKLIHAGISFSMHELAKDGITFTDTDGKGEPVSHSRRDEVMLADVLKHKIEDMMEGIERGFNNMYWRDGTQDAKLVPGIRSFVLDDPTSATVVGGIDQASNTWWRNRASLAISVTTPADQLLVTELQKEWRQLRRYGGNPNLVLAGSDFLEAFETELRAKGNYTLTGWAKTGTIDASVADVAFKGTMFEYDPTLDDEGLSKYAYVLDTRFIHPMVIEGEDEKKHRPARPENKYVFYRAVTWMGGLVCRQRNAHGVYSIA